MLRRCRRVRECLRQPYGCVLVQSTNLARSGIVYLVVSQTIVGARAVDRELGLEHRLRAVLRIAWPRLCGVSFLQ